MRKKLQQKRQREVAKILEERMKSLLRSGRQVETVFQEGEESHVNAL